MNHNGSIKNAKHLIDAAVEAKADYIKFQTFKAENLVTKKAEKSDYQKNQTIADESQFDMLNINNDDGVTIKFFWRDEYEYLSTILWSNLCKKNAG